MRSYVRSAKQTPSVWRPLSGNADSYDIAVKFLKTHTEVNNMNRLILLMALECVCLDTLN